MGFLDGKVALITGAGQGVGRGIALAMAKQGAAIAVAGRTESKIKSVCTEIAAFGGRAVPILCEVKLAEDVTRCVAETLRPSGASTYWSTTPRRCRWVACWRPMSRNTGSVSNPAR